MGTGFYSANQLGRLTGTSHVFILNLIARGDLVPDSTAINQHLFATSRLEALRERIDSLRLRARPQLVTT